MAILFGKGWFKAWAYFNGLMDFIKFVLMLNTNTCEYTALDEYYSKNYLGKALKT